MTLKKLLHLIFILFPWTIIAQSSSIQGFVQNDNGEPIPFANVLLTKGNEIIDGTITEDDGSFIIKEVKNGNFVLKIQLIGFETKTLSIDLTGKVDFQKIILMPHPEMLEEVIVEGSIPLIQRKIDRLVFNVEKSIAASGGNAINALSVTPRILVNNGEIKMIGKNNMGVMVDGRIKRMEGEELLAFLQSIPADMIQSIEIISNPPAKYSAEGNSGLINIVLKKAKINYWNADIRSNVKIASKISAGVGASLNFNRRKFSLSSSLHYANNNNMPEFHSQIYYPESIWEENTVEDVKSNALDNIRVSTSYDFGKLLMGANYNRYESNIDAIGRTNTVVSDYNQSIDSIITTIDDGDVNRVTNTFNYHLIYEIDTLGKQIAIDFDYLDYENIIDNTIRTQTLAPDLQPVGTEIEVDNSGIHNISNYSLNIDVTHPLAVMDLSYGARATFINTTNTFKRSDSTIENIIANPSVTDNFDFTEDTQAIYLSGQRKFNEKWEAKIGLRLENTQTKGHSVDLNQTTTRSYTEFFPTGYVSYKMNDKNLITLNYGRRISRPSFNLLNPFRWIYSAYSYSEGNPYLRPSFNHNLEVDYSIGNSWNISLYYSHLENGYDRIPLIDPEQKIQREIPLNFVVSDMYGLNQYWSIEIGDWLETYVQADIYYSSAKSEIPDRIDFLSSWNGIFSIQNNISLSSEENFLFNLSGDYFTEGADRLDRNDDFGQLNAGFRLYLMKRKLELNLYANDIFRTANPRFTSFSNKVKYTNRNYYDQQYIQFSVKYSFGGTAAGLRSRSKNNEEQRRID